MQWDHTRAVISQKEKSQDELDVLDSQQLHLFYCKKLELQEQNVDLRNISIHILTVIHNLGHELKVVMV